MKKNIWIVIPIFVCLAVLLNGCKPTTKIVPATITPMPPTNTVEVAKSGHWEGDHAVSFDLSSDGHITNFTMTVPFDYGQNGSLENCTVTPDDFTVVNNSFDVTKGVAITQNTLSFAGAIGLPTPIVTQTSGSNDMTIEAHRITGTFVTPTSITGTYSVQVCGSNFRTYTEDKPIWNAAWKQP